MMELNATLVRKQSMDFLRRCLQETYELVTSPGFRNLDPAEQEQLCEQLIWTQRARRRLAKSRPPHRAWRPIRRF